jgi:negative regulator of flagellin synthesis FlgM
MSRIDGVGNNAAIHKVVNPLTARPTSAEPASRSRAADKLELSGVSHLLASLKTHDGLRVDKVATIKAQIEAGTYESDAKLDGAIDRLLDDVWS